MGVKGAAIGTLVARIFEFFAFLAIIMQKKYNFKGNIKEYFGIPKEVLKKLINVSTPIFFAESFWVVGTFFLGVAYAKGGTIFAVGSAISDLLINIASRKQNLYPMPPPGAINIVTNREGKVD